MNSPTISRIFALALALILTFSHVALASHETVHSGTELGHCELCFSHAQPLTATIHSEHFPEVDSLRCKFSEHIPNRTVSGISNQPYHSRAPPAIV
jgi:hypothetical protein